MGDKKLKENISKFIMSGQRLILQSVQLRF